MKLNVNGVDKEVKVDHDTPLLWILRDILQLTGTKYGCGIAQCGACTVHIDGEAVKSCQVSVGDVSGKITTIEGLGSQESLHPVHQAWVEKQVAQCGYCQSGQMMAAASLLQTNKIPSDEEINDAMSGNLCRCGTYPRIKEAIHHASKIISEGSDN